MLCDCAAVMFSFMCRTRSSTGPKPVPLLPRNEEENKQDNKVLIKGAIPALHCSKLVMWCMS